MSSKKKGYRELDKTLATIKQTLIDIFYYCRLFFIKQRNATDRHEKVAAIVLSWKRVNNIPHVVVGLKKQSFIDDIIIYHNHPSWLWVPGCKNIFSKKNSGCIVRHELASSLKGYDYFVFSDDDLMLSCDIAEEVIPAIRAHGRESVLGLFGRNVNFTSKENPYTKGDYIISRQSIKPVDIILGRFHIISKKGIQVLAKSELNTAVLRSEDDIRANLTLQMKFQKPSYLIPTKKKIIELQAANALEHREYHKEYRNKAVQEALKRGWRMVRPENI